MTGDEKEFLVVVREVHHVYHLVTATSPEAALERVFEDGHALGSRMRSAEPIQARIPTPSELQAWDRGSLPSE